MVELRHQIPIQAQPNQVYALLATPAGLRSWWTADAQVDPQVGGQADVGFDKRAMVFHMKIDQLDAGKRVVMKCHGDHPEWAGTTLTWTIGRDHDATTLSFAHSGWKAMTEFCASCNTVWGELMHRIKDSAEGKIPGPHWRE